MTPRCRPYSGLLAWCGMPAGKASQPCLVSVHTVRAGGGKSGSAKAPTATLIISGVASPCQKTVEPQVGQNQFVSHLPLSA